MPIGELAGLATAAAWATSSLLYGKSRLTAWQMNMSKNVLAAIVFLLQLVVLAWLYNTPVFSAPRAAVLYLCASGLIGVMLGDTCYFRSIQILGPRVALIVSTSAPAFGGLLGWLIHGQSPSIMLWAGIFTTISGIVWVVREPAAGNESPGLYPGATRAGILYGLFSALCQATGGAMSQTGMGYGCGPLEGSFYRIGIAGVMMVLLTPHLAIPAYKGATHIETRGRLIPAILLGTWLGIWLSQVAIKYSDLAVALTLMSTTPLFALFLVWCFLSQKVTPTALLGALVAIAGVALTVYSQM